MSDLSNEYLHEILEPNIIGNDQKRANAYRSKESSAEKGQVGQCHALPTFLEELSIFPRQSLPSEPT